MNDNVEKTIFEKPILHLNVQQLTLLKKVNNGFNPSDSVIDVEECGYAITTGRDILFTYGIDTCCGVILTDGNKRVLFHLDSSINPCDVLKLTNQMDLEPDTKVIISPGVNKMEGCFDYPKLAEMYQKLGYTVEFVPFSLTMGFIKVLQDKVIIGSALDKEKSESLPIKTRKELISELYEKKRQVIEWKNENNSNKRY